MPRSNATIDSSTVASAGHSVPEGYGTISVSAFMDGLTAAEALTSNGFDHSVVHNLPPILLNTLTYILRLLVNSCIFLAEI
jgi:hypothetical protein